MAYSTQSAVSDGTLINLTISIEYFDRSEISVLYDGGVNTDKWTWVGTTDKIIQFYVAVPNGVAITVRRTTDIAQPRHEFTEGAAFTANSVDENSEQLLHIVQEARENAGAIADFFTAVDMHGNQLKNLGTAIDAQDAVPLSQISTHDATMVDYVNAAAASASTASTKASEANASAGTSAARATNSMNSANASANFATLAEGSAAAAASSADSASDSAGAAASTAASLSQYTGAALGGDLSFVGTAQRIKGDFSNATYGNRTLFQTSTPNGNTTVGVIPNGTANSAGVIIYSSSSDPNNSSSLGMLVLPTEARIQSQKYGTGVELPLTLFSGGIEALRLKVDGNASMAGTLAMGSAFGFRNVLVNGEVTRVNQRAVVNWAAVANGNYGYDGWKKVDASNIVQIVEAGNYIPSATYTLSGVGVTTQQVTAPASGNWTIPNIPIAATFVQLEIGTAATPFERRPYGLEFALCQRYYQVGTVYFQCYTAAGVGFGYRLQFPVQMGAAPTVAFSNAVYLNASGVTAIPISENGMTVTALGTAAGVARFQANYTLKLEL